VLLSRRTAKPRSRRVAVSQPDLAVLDFDFGAWPAHGSERLLPVIAAIMPVLVVTNVTAASHQGMCLDAGARGVVPKQRPLSDLVAAVEIIASGGLVPDGDTRVRLVEAAHQEHMTLVERHRRISTLTTSEHRVLDALLQGMSAREISRDRAVSLTTVRAHIRGILSKLGVNSQLGAVAFVYGRGGDPEVRRSMRV
jgi:two-component system, NarL family, nitrate/nitrite response regulator NarL